MLCYNLELTRPRGAAYINMLQRIARASAGGTEGDRSTLNAAQQSFALPVIWLSITCLDAPLVALVWQWIFAEAFHVHLATVERLALFLTAWLIYLADRFADSFSIPNRAPVSARQRFCAAYRKTWIALGLTLTAAAAIIAAAFLTHRTLVIGGIIATAISIYLLINHLASFVWRTLPIKEVTIGCLFALGTLTAINCADHRFFLAVILFSMLCSLNCLSISVWEGELDRAQGKVSFGSVHPLLAFVPQVGCWFLAAVALLATSFYPLRPIALCIAFSALLLGFLHSLPAFPCDMRVACADLVLLTPVSVCVLRTIG
jgi:hypothetical protein